VCIRKKNIIHIGLGWVGPYPWFQASTGGLGTFVLGIRETIVVNMDFSCLSLQNSR
jgi:hypothetical protein